MNYKLILPPGSNLVQEFTTIPHGVTSLDLSWNNLDSISTVELMRAFANIPASVTSLDLRRNDLGYKSADELVHAFSSIPKHVVSLNLCLNYLHELSLENLVLLKDSLKYLQTVYLGYETVKNMSKEERQALGSVFPNVQKIILIDMSGKEIHPSYSITNSNLIRELSGKADAPSLLNQCILFAKKHQTNIEDLNIPQELKESILTFNPY
ncbi:TPA: hypothetical protein F8R96_04470 [Legionella pneumophila]|nr:hypothetical protein [Legionella pneumophila]HBI2945818.1 hypothetical protein [Legionella pneumophila]